VSKTNRYLLVGSRIENRVRAFKLKSNTEYKSPAFIDYKFYDAVFTPNGRILSCSSDDEPIIRRA
jgi:hypothetical protein